MHGTFSRSLISSADVEAHLLRLVSAEASSVTDAARYHLSAGGARVRAQMGLEAARALGLSAATSLACAAAPELLHNASLVHDDLQDGDTLRRDKPAVWSLYGRDVAVSTGDLLISAAYMAIATHPKAGLALYAMHDAIAVTISGQAWESHAKTLSPEEHAAVAARKSGPLLALPIRLALIAAGAPGETSAIRAGHAIAVAYQTIDDLADREADQASGAANICLSLEAAGHGPALARSIAREHAHAALSTARKDARELPHDAGAPFVTLADRLETQLKEPANAA
jgi:geranylgeranyl diphosphate synthase type II